MVPSRADYVAHSTQPETRPVSDSRLEVLTLDEESMLEAKIVAVDYGLIRGKRSQATPQMMRVVDDLLRRVLSL